MEKYKFDCIFIILLLLILIDQVFYVVMSYFETFQCILYSLEIVHQLYYYFRIRLSKSPLILVF